MKRSGFTLIELSIVLIIIGLIIGGVMKGKDLINSANQKKIYNTWVKQWQVTINEYEDRTGALLGDGVVNGGTATENGLFDNFYERTQGTVPTVLQKTGLDLPVSNIAGTRGGQYKIQGKYTIGRSDLYFRNNANVDNVLEFTNIPIDVAIAFDKMTDGTIDRASGDFTIYPIPTPTAPGAAATLWGDASSGTTVNVALKL